MSADVLLDRLERVRKCGGGWIARCPAHEDKSASLSVADADGRVLIHCFAGCTPLAVVEAAGLRLQDLFERHDFATMTRAERSRIRELKRLPDWRAALNALGQESTVVEIAARAMARGRKPSQESLMRIQDACKRIGDARMVLR